MRIASHLDHVALLVQSVDAAARNARPLGEPQARQEFPEEGTAEIYIGASTDTSRLLLMEPIQAGSYRRALEKRGPGLHHLGLLVPDVEAYVAALAGSGWMLLPQSLATVKKTRTAWLARPGTGFLVEAHERPVPEAKTPLLCRLELPHSVATPRLVESLGCGTLFPVNAAGALLSTPQITLQLKEIIK